MKWDGGFFEIQVRTRSAFQYLIIQVSNLSWHYSTSVKNVWFKVITPRELGHSTAYPKPIAAIAGICTSGFGTSPLPSENLPPVCCARKGHHAEEPISGPVAGPPWSLSDGFLTHPMATFPAPLIPSQSCNERMRKTKQRTEVPTCRVSSKWFKVLDVNYLLFPQHKLYGLKSWSFCAQLQSFHATHMSTLVIRKCQMLMILKVGFGRFSLGGWSRGHTLQWSEATLESGNHAVLWNKHRPSSLWPHSIENALCYSTGIES